MKLNLKNHTKKLFKSSWFITLFATTLGVLLALYLSNLNAKLKVEKRKNFAIENLKKELMNNANELKDSNHNDKLLSFFQDISTIVDDISTEFITSKSAMNEITKKYPEFIKIINSNQANKNEYSYIVEYEFELHLEDVQNIAWETSKMSNLTNEFNYDCLQYLVRTYSLQELYIREQQKIINYFVNTDHTKMFKAMTINKQLRLQLIENIEETKENIDNCN